MIASPLIDWFDPIFWRVALGGALRLATPIAFAALGETVAERSGTLNLGVDGIMTAGALTAVLGATVGGWPLGLALAALVGLALGFGMAAATLLGRANQVVAGIAISVVSAGLTTYVFQSWQPSGQSMPLVSLAPTYHVPLLADIPFLGEIFFSQSVLTYGCAALFAITSFALRRTRIGLVLRASGDDPHAALLRGVAVVRTRALALAFGGLTAGLGGAAITVGVLGAYSDGVTAGRGYIAIAVVIIGRWSPLGALLGSLLFAFFESLSLRIQGHFLGLPNEVFSVLPYVVTLTVLAFTAKSRVAPRQLGVTFDPNPSAHSSTGLA